MDKQVLEITCCRTGEVLGWISKEQISIKEFVTTTDKKEAKVFEDDQEAHFWYLKVQGVLGTSINLELLED